MGFSCGESALRCAPEPSCVVAWDDAQARRRAWSSGPDPQSFDVPSQHRFDEAARASFLHRHLPAYGDGLR